MKKKYDINEVPRDYRRNYKEELVEILKACGISAIVIAYFVILIICFA